MKRENFKARELWLTTSDAARLLNVNPRTIRRYVERGEIEHVAIEKGWTAVKYLVRVDNFNSR